MQFCISANENYGRVLVKKPKKQKPANSDVHFLYYKNNIADVIVSV